MARSMILKTAALVVVALLASLFAISPAVAADDQPERVRFGTPSEPGSATPGDGDLITTTTPTLVLDGPADGAEIMVVDAAGLTVGGSGPLDTDRWDVAEGSLTAGGSYEWTALAPTGTVTVGTSFPRLDHDLNVTGEMIIGSRILDHEQVQGAQTFTVATGVGAPAAAAGLTADFFPHYDPAAEIPLDEDGNPVEELPPTILPGPGSETVSETASWVVMDGLIDLCVLSERAPRPGPDGPQDIVYTPTDWIVCEVSYGLEADTAITAAGGQAAAYNIAGTNVAPSFTTTITSDQAIDDGFVLSTAGEQRIAAAFPLQTEFGFRALGYIEVPETGTYRFGTQSPGGAALHIYDTTEADLGKTEVSHPDAWRPATQGEPYRASSERFEYLNEERGHDSSSDMAYFYRDYEYDYGKDDADWFQAPGDHIQDLTEELRQAGPRADVVRWGDEVTLEGGRQYPVAFTGWLGPIPGDVGIYVDSAATGEIPVPFDWLTAAPAGTVDFDRGMNATGVAEIEGMALAMSGHGDVLASLGTDGTLRFYDSDGGHAWHETAALTGIGAHQPSTADVAYDIDAETASIGLHPVDEVSGPVSIDTHSGQIRVTAGPLEFVDEAFPQPATIDHLELIFDRNGDFVSGEVDGYAPGGWDRDDWVVVDEVHVASNIDLETGRIGVYTGSSERHAEMMYTNFLLLDASETDPFAGAWAMAFNDEGNTLVVAPDRGIVENRTENSYRVASTNKDLAGQITGRSRTPTLVFDGPSASLTDWFSVNVNVVATGPTLPGVARIDELEFTLDGAGQIIDGTASGGMQMSGTTWPISDIRGHRNDNGRLHLDFISRVNGFTRTYGMVLAETDVEPYQPGEGRPLDVALIDKIDPEAAWSETNAAVTWVNDLLEEAGMDLPTLGDRDAPIQSVQVVPDGNTVAVFQPNGDGDGYRVVVIDRDDRNDEWSVIGDFGATVDDDLARLSGDAPVAVGRDGDARFVAHTNDNRIRVHEWTPTRGWDMTLDISGGQTVASMGFDYFAEHLAIGRPNLGTVTVYERPWWSSDWTHQHDLEGTGALGSQVAYTWGLLTVADAANSSVRVYRDTGWAAWSTYSDWVETTVDGLGSGLLFNSGGTTARARVATTAIPIRDAFERAWLALDRNVAIGAFPSVPTHIG